MTRTMTTRAPVFRRLVFDGWRGMIGWIIGIAATVSLYLPLYPSMASAEMTQLLDNLPRELVEVLGYENVTSGPGYTHATFFGLIGYVLLVIAATAWSASFIAAMEESGRLELTLAHGVGRVQYAVESIAALMTKIVALAAIAFGLIWMLNAPAELELVASNLLAETVAWASLGLVSGTAALAAGALTGRRVWAIGAGTGVAVIGYVLDAVAKSSDTLERLQMLSPFYWAYGHSPLANGFDWGGLGLLLGLSAVFMLVTTWALSRRDILG